jgi:Fe-S-cluster-containing dehydrogenase component
MTRYAMVIDTKTCIGCGDCVVACKTENKVPDGLNRDWIVEATKGTYPNLTTEFRSERCNHCSNPTCVTLCPTGASHLWKDTNIVLVEPEKCTGCKACIAACPYDARLVMHPDGYIDKCTFCHHRVEEGLDPACVSSCPTRCMYFGSLDDPSSEVSALLRTRQYKVLSPETGNEPNVYYLI